jgi:hypothetical protein
MNLIVVDIRQDQRISPFDFFVRTALTFAKPSTPGPVLEVSTNIMSGVRNHLVGLPM